LDMTKNEVPNFLFPILHFGFSICVRLH
jgi:hypothetical protein